MRKLALTSFSALLLSTFAAAGCGGFGAEDAPAAGNAPAGEPGSPGSQPGEAKAAPVTGTPSASELTEAFGVFVSPRGSDQNPGDRARPFASIGAGIAQAQRVGKRVYVCTGTFRESLTLADSISIIGGLDCSMPEWRVGAEHTRVEAPSSPAMVAKDITSATRIEGLDVVAPNATEPGGSSIGLLAVRASGLSIVSSHIESGNGKKGADGVDGTQLVQAGTLNGADGALERDACHNYTCPTVRRGNTPGGTSVCAGAPGHDGEPGGYGGTGGLHWFSYYMGVWEPYSGAGNAHLLAEPRTGGFAAVGVDGASAAAAGILSAEGYTPSDGTAGTDGAPGKGGLGGNGVPPTESNPPFVEGRDPRWNGNSGAGGGAGGCPGLAGTAGRGGGASIAVLVIDAPIRLEKSDLLAHDGGDGGRGTMGSSPTPGGKPGLDVAGKAGTRGYSGGSGGASGTSGSGAGGPSYGLAFTGTAPEMVATTAKAGRGGAGVPEETSADALGNAKTIPASADGAAQDVLQP